MAEDGKYESLLLEYSDPESLMYKKLMTLDSYISNGESLLDIGAGTGDLIELEKNKFNLIYGVDIDKESVDICIEKFGDDPDIHIIQGDIRSLDFIDRFDLITACDVLEHLTLEDCRNTLKIIYSLLKDDGKFIFTGPGIFEKIRIVMGKDPTHQHSHSSYGWSKIIRSAGFKIVSTETIEFPLVNHNLLRKKLHIFGKCCLIVCKKMR